MGDRGRYTPPPSIFTRLTVLFREERRRKSSIYKISQGRHNIGGDLRVGKFMRSKHSKSLKVNV